MLSRKLTWRLMRKGRKLWKSTNNFEKSYKKPDPWGIIGDKEEERKNKLISNLIPKVQSDKPALLDIGCGEGTFTNYYKKQTGYDVFGCDISKTATERANKTFKNCKFFTHDFRNEYAKKFWDKFNVIMFIESLYYINPKELNKVITATKRICAKECFLVISCGMYYNSTDIRRIFRKLVKDWKIRKERFNNVNTYIMYGKVKRR